MILTMKKIYFVLLAVMFFFGCYDYKFNYE